MTLIAAIVLGALHYDKLPLFTAQNTEYSAYFAEASGLAAGAPVQVSGFQVGQVTSVELDGPRVLDQIQRRQEHSARRPHRGRDQGARACWAPRCWRSPRAATGNCLAPIPIERTTPAYQLPDALGDLADTISALNTDRLDESLNTLAADIPRHPTAAEDRRRRRSPVLADAQRTRCATARSAGQRQQGDRLCSPSAPIRSSA